MNLYSIDNLNEIWQGDFDTIIDVRSAAEFGDDCLPNAVNMPVLNDQERAIVGTIYKQNPLEARKQGASLVAQNTSKHIADYLSQKDADWKPLVYCWRGGQRSKAFATVLSMVGWQVSVLEGGYRRYRKHICEQLHHHALAHRLVLLDGNTGSAKTDILRRAQKLGAQVLDLEQLANHRGSVFGGGKGAQPSQRKFESLLAEKLAALAPERTVFIEAESSKIGKLLLPKSLWKAMCSAPRILIGAPLEARAHYLLETYQTLREDGAFFEAALKKLARFHPKDRIEGWRENFHKSQFAPLINSLVKNHYDPAYQRASARHKPAILKRLETDWLGCAERQKLAQELCNSAS